MTTLRLLAGPPSAAARSAAAVPDSRTSRVSWFERNTRRLACEPVGLAISVVSFAAAAVKASVSFAPPPAMPPSVPAASAPAERR